MAPLSKRELLKLSGLSFCVSCAAHLLVFPETMRAQTARRGLIKTRLSPYFSPLAGGKIQCELCPRRCRVSDGKRGFCRVRENREGKFYSLVYGNPCVLQLDPRERGVLSPPA